MKSNDSTANNQKQTTDPTEDFKISDSVHICFFKSGITLGPIVKRSPTFLTLSGTVASIYQPGTTKFLSIQFPKWPLRYLQEESRCFKTKEEADKVVTANNLKLAEHLKQQGF